MSKFMAPYADHTYAALRIVSGFMFACHGAQKLLSFPTAPPPEVPAFVLYTAGPIELFGGLLLVAGLFTRWAAFVCSGTMAAAYWMAHGTNHVLPLINRGELAALYCFVFLYISARGPGIFSVDAMRSSR